MRTSRDSGVAAGPSLDLGDAFTSPTSAHLDSSFVPAPDVANCWRNRYLTAVRIDHPVRACSLEPQGAEILCIESPAWPTALFRGVAPPGRPSAVADPGGCSGPSAPWATARSQRSSARQALPQASGVTQASNRPYPDTSERRRNRIPGSLRYRRRRRHELAISINLSRSGASRARRTGYATPVTHLIDGRSERLPGARSAAWKKFD